MAATAAAAGRSTCGSTPARPRSTTSATSTSSRPPRVGGASARAGTARRARTSTSRSRPARGCWTARPARCSRTSSRSASRRWSRAAAAAASATPTSPPPPTRRPSTPSAASPARSRTIRLELRLIADVGLVGLPNAGKSTLLAALTAATPKIADYPFTTLEPNLGVMDLGMDDGRRPTIADVPGLIEGASSGAGLGHAFLRHVERTRILVHLVDGASRDPRWDHDVIRDELRAHDPALLEKPILVAFNKLDLAAAREAWPAFLREARASGIEALAISADTGEGLDELRAAIARLLPDADGPLGAARARRRGRAPARGPDGRVRRRSRRTGPTGSPASGSSGSSPRPTSTTRSPRSGSSASSSGRGSTGRCARRGSGRATRCGSAARSWSGTRPRTTVDRGIGARSRRPPT